jgi:hypothetical protein
MMLPSKLPGRGMLGASENELESMLVYGTATHIDSSPSTADYNLRIIKQYLERILT